MAGFDDTFKGSGTGHAGGTVPDPGSTAGQQRFLNEDGLFEIPGTASPPNPYGVSTAQQGCNIAGYLSNTIIKAALQQALDSIQQGQNTTQYGATILGLIPGAGFAFLVIQGLGAALNALYGAVNSGTKQNYTDALTDQTLWSKMTCAIYGAISGAGHVTAANFSAVATAVAGVSYTHADVITTIAAYVNNLGASGLMALQGTGALAQYDCSGCGGGTPTATGPGPIVLTPAPIAQLEQSGSLILYIPAGSVQVSARVTFPKSYGVIAPNVVSGSASRYTAVSSHDIDPAGFTVTAMIAYPRADDDGLLVTWIALPGGALSGTGSPAGASQSVGGSGASGLSSHSVGGFGVSGTFVSGSNSGHGGT